MKTKTLLEFFKPTFVLKIFCILLAISLVILGEIFFIEFLSGFWGVYFTLALVAFLSLFGLIAGYGEIVSKIALIKSEIANGYYIEKDFYQLSGAYCSIILIIIPGFFTAFFGIIGFFPVIRSIYGRIIFYIIPNSPEELYESMNLCD